MLVLLPRLSTLEAWDHMSQHFLFLNGSDYVILQWMLNKISYTYYYFGFSLEFIPRYSLSLGERYPMFFLQSFGSISKGFSSEIVPSPL